MLRCCVLLFIFFSGAIHAQDRKYGSNMADLSIMANNAGPGVGLSYERQLGKNARFSFLAPFSVNRVVVAPSYGHGPASPDARSRNFYMHLFTPGFRYYPTGSDGVGRYGLSLQALFGSGKGYAHTHTNATANAINRSMLGIFLGNSIHFMLGRFLRLSMNLGFGLLSDSDIDAKGNPFGQISLSLGPRW